MKISVTQDTKNKKIKTSSRYLILNRAKTRERKLERENKMEEVVGGREEGEEMSDLDQSV